LNHYLAGSYDKNEDFQALNKKINEIVGKDDGCRIFYLALPPTVYTSVSQLLSYHCKAKKLVLVKILQKK
jgi:glucose-6-phosphate 1-dehydrogenase